MIVIEIAKRKKYQEIVYFHMNVLLNWETKFKKKEMIFGFLINKLMKHNIIKKCIKIMKILNLKHRIL